MSQSLEQQAVESKLLGLSDDDVSLFPIKVVTSLDTQNFTYHKSQKVHKPPRNWLWTPQELPPLKQQLNKSLQNQEETNLHMIPKFITRPLTEMIVKRKENTALEQAPEDVRHLLWTFSFTILAKGSLLKYTHRFQRPGKSKYCCSARQSPQSPRI